MLQVHSASCNIAQVWQEAVGEAHFSHTGRIVVPVWENSPLPFPPCMRYLLSSQALSKHNFTVAFGCEDYAMTLEMGQKESPALPALPALEKT